jgi:nucleotide-binding universal stress UspA family protein
MKILIGVDDSPHSNAALDFVKSMRWPVDTQVTVLSVARTTVVAYSMVDAGPVSWLQEVEREQVRESQELTTRVEIDLRKNGFQTRARVLSGDPRELIIRTAIEENSDLIVVGSHGRTGLSKLLLGSVASHVVTHAPCSVMVARIPQALQS